VGAQPVHGECPFLAARLAESPDLRERVTAARALGISLRRFDGWTPTKTTRYRRDRRGRVLEAVTTVEPEWNDEQRGLMLALARYQSLLHGPCGGYLPETTDRANEGAYKATAPSRCHKCTAIGEAAGPYRESPHPQALMYPIEFTKG
jgi:hypothetical protein